jgi:GcrA cell cycle regulator
MPPPGAWHTRSLTERLIELHGLTGMASLSMAEIAEKLSSEFRFRITRNAVIGKARRLGLGEHPEKKPPKKPKPEPVVRRRYVRPRPAAVRVLRAKITSDHPLTLLQLRNGDCTWPLGGIEARTPYLFCGKPCDVDRSWCPEHWARGRIPLPQAKAVSKEIA